MGRVDGPLQLITTATEVRLDVTEKVLEAMCTAFVRMLVVSGGVTVPETRGGITSITPRLP